MAPSTFASAAAASNHDQAQSRDGASEWSRRPNGATQTFRRQSNATTTTASNPPNDPPSVAPTHAPRYVPPHRNGTLADTRYSKPQLLESFRSQQNADGALRDGLSDLFLGGWQPEAANGTPTPSWARSDHARDPQSGPEVCWDRDGAVEPLGLTDLDDEERELFQSSVNTPLKPPSGQNKENQQSNGPQPRKVSVSQNLNSPSAFGLPSPTAARGGPRRRDTSESYPFPNPLASPTTAHNRDDQRPASPPPSLLRRRTDLKDAHRPEELDRDGEEKSIASPFGSLKRHPTGPLTGGLAGPPSPWSTTPQTAGFSPMGSFGNIGLGGGPALQASQTEKRSGLGSGRAESRFKSLLQKDSNEDIGGRSVERRTSISSLPRVNENDSWRPQDRQDLAGLPLDEADEDAPLPSGSAALAAGSDLSPSHFRNALRGFDTPGRTATRDDLAFGAFGMTADHAPGFGHSHLQSRDATQHTPAQHRSGPQMGGHEPMSPTDTNPYQSPEQHGVDHLQEDLDADDAEFHRTHLPGLRGFGAEQSSQHLELGGLGVFPNPGRAAGSQGPASDRSQTSSTGPGRAFPGLGTLGPLGGMPGSAAWPGTQGALGTPRHAAGASSAFGSGIFATSMSELQSPGLAGLGGTGMFSQQTGGGLPGGRASSMFPQGMQDQVRLAEQGNERDHSIEHAAQQQFGAPGTGPVGQRDGMFSGQGFSEPKRGQPEMEQKATDIQMPPAGLGAPGQQLASQLQDQASIGPGSGQPPAPQQRTMVMPDRMRWIYKDPQGQTQGPWSGLEMHDWYRAGFFSPELLVRKAEDVDYEPLAQLIRRIGNSREPFLVPQIGIPHGPPSTQGPWASPIAPGPAPGGAQPPFASSFPSFGTTLTAEQQNALERRKQEEQYLMARQKEHLAQAQIAQRMQGMHPTSHSGLAPGHSQGPLHHHSSAQSLHSQPSFGSMTSPSAYQQSPVQGPAGSTQSHGQGAFDGSVRGAQSGGLGAVGAGVDSLGHIREEEIPGIMDRLNLSGRAENQFGAPGHSFPTQHGQSSGTEHNVQQMLQDRAMLQQEQAQHDAAHQDESQQQPASNGRLREFQQLQGPGSALDARFQSSMGKPSEQSAFAGQLEHAQRQPQEPLSLTEQVQKAASAKQSPSVAPSAWGKAEGGMPQPFPPAPSQSPLPAPAAQRTGRQSVADQLHVESSRPQTPRTGTPSTAVAPWAKEPAEVSKGPSLKEIQVMEAKKAAQAEELAVAARRAAVQKEMEAQTLAAAAAAAPLQPGLPSSANWAANNGASPATPTTTTASAWAKATQQKPPLTQSKSMAQIQKDEEARKKKVAAAQVQASANAMAGVANPAGSKSYANLAGKVSAAVPGQPGGAWTTVGASGKTKTPVTAAAPAPPAGRIASGGLAPGVQPSMLKKAPTRSSSTTIPGAINAQEEFRKWAVAELKPDLNKTLSADDFVASLIFLPPDADIITEAVHGSSSTLDSRHFAEEFIRRKRLADKGLVDASMPPKSASPLNPANPNTGGWSEVAKKGPAKEAAAAAAGREDGHGSFRVVAAKKKGGKR